MELRVIWTALVRRWYLVVVVLLCAGGAAFYLADRVGPTYTATGAVLVFPPYQSVAETDTGAAGGNPYLELGGVGQARDIVIRTLTSKATVDELAESYPDSTYEATPDFTNSAPIILVVVESSDSDQAIAAMNNILDRIPPALAGLQDGLDLQAKDLITSRPLIADTTPEVGHTDQLRAAVLAGAAVLAFGLLLIALIDGLVESRRRARRRSRSKGKRAWKQQTPKRARKSRSVQKRPTETGTEPESPIGFQLGSTPDGAAAPADGTDLVRTES